MYQMDRLRQRTSRSNVNHSQQTSCTVDECVILHTRSMRTIKLKECTNQSSNSRTQHTNIGGEFQRCVLDRRHPKRETREETGRTMVDYTELRSTSHDADNTRDKQATHRTPKGVQKQLGLHIGGQETHVLKQRC